LFASTTPVVAALHSSAKRRSIWRLRPSVQPSSCIACLKADMPAADWGVAFSVSKQHSDAAHGLRVRKQRPSHGTCDQADELSPLHSLTIAKNTSQQEKHISNPTQEGLQPVTPVWGRKRLLSRRPVAGLAVSLSEVCAAGRPQCAVLHQDIEGRFRICRYVDHPHSKQPGRISLRP